MKIIFLTPDSGAVNQTINTYIKIQTNYQIDTSTFIYPGNENPTFLIIDNFVKDSLNDSTWLEYAYNGAFDFINDTTMSFTTEDLQYDTEYYLIIQGLNGIVENGYDKDTVPFPESIISFKTIKPMYRLCMSSLDLTGAYYRCGDTLWFTFNRPLELTENNLGKIISIVKTDSISSDSNRIIYQSEVPSDTWLSEDQRTFFIKPIQSLFPGDYNYVKYRLWYLTGDSSDYNDFYLNFQTLYKITLSQRTVDSTDTLPDYFNFYPRGLGGKDANIGDTMFIRAYPVIDDFRFIRWECLQDTTINGCTADSLVIIRPCWSFAEDLDITAVYDMRTSATFNIYPPLFGNITVYSSDGDSIGINGLYEVLPDDYIFVSYTNTSASYTFNYWGSNVGLFDSVATASIKLGPFDERYSEIDPRIFDYPIDVTPHVGINPDFLCDEYCLNVVAGNDALTKENFSNVVSVVYSPSQCTPQGQSKPSASISIIDEDCDCWCIDRIDSDREGNLFSSSPDDYSIKEITVNFTSKGWGTICDETITVYIKRKIVRLFVTVEMLYGGEFPEGLYRPPVHTTEDYKFETGFVVPPTPKEKTAYFVKDDENKKDMLVYDIPCGSKITILRSYHKGKYVGRIASKDFVITPSTEVNFDEFKSEDVFCSNHSMTITLNDSPDDEDMGFYLLEVGLQMDEQNFEIFEWYDPDEEWSDIEDGVIQSVPHGSYSKIKFKFNKPVNTNTLINSGLGNINEIRLPILLELITDNLRIRNPIGCNDFEVEHITLPYRYLWGPDFFTEENNTIVVVPLKVYITMCMDMKPDVCKPFWNTIAKFQQLRIVVEGENRIDNGILSYKNELLQNPIGLDDTSNRKHFWTTFPTITYKIDNLYFEDDELTNYEYSTIFGLNFTLELLSIGQKYKIISSNYKIFIEFTINNNFLNTYPYCPNTKCFYKFNQLYDNIIYSKKLSTGRSCIISGTCFWLKKDGEILNNIYSIVEHFNEIYKVDNEYDYNRVEIHNIGNFLINEIKKEYQSTDYFLNTNTHFSNEWLYLNEKNRFYYFNNTTLILPPWGLKYYSLDHYDHKNEVKFMFDKYDWKKDRIGAFYNLNSEWQLITNWSF